jgi:hypothetical protein
MMKMFLINNGGNKMKGFIRLLILFLLYTNVIAQGEAAIPTLVFQQSTLFFGAGQIGAAIPMQDPAGFYLNPAQLGYFSRNNNLAVSFMPEKTKWGPSSFGSNFQTFSLAAGYNFKAKNENLPLSIGAGYIQNKMQYKSPSENYDSFNCFSIGAGYDYYIQFNAGIAVKSIKSVITTKDVMDMREQTITATGTAFDFGFMLTAPITNLLSNNIRYDLNDNSFLRPKIDITLGYSLTNLGKEIYYVDPVQSDPIPRTARLGYTVDLGIGFGGAKTKINGIDYSFTAEAEDILINRNNSGGLEYQSMLGDIDFGKNLIALRSDNNVVVHKGHIFRLFETIILTSGRYYGYGYGNTETNGYGLSSQGVFKLLANAITEPIINYIKDHLVIEYYGANISAGTGMETNFKTISVSIRGMRL